MITGSASAPLTAAELDVLSVEAGEGFWLLDLPRLRATITGFEAAFAAAGWATTELAWSCKTLWVPAAVRAAVSAGCRPEVVSRHEFELVRALGLVRPGMIVNGPLKTADDLLAFAEAGAVINVDSLEEASLIALLAGERPDLMFDVGLRVNVDIGQGPRGRFGLDHGSGDVARAYTQLSAVPTVRVGGLHLHIAGARDTASYTRRIEALISISDELWPAGEQPDFLNIGGGFAGTLPEFLVDQLGYEAPTPDQYAAAIVPSLRARWPEAGPTLLLEPGIALAADAMRFAARVGATKTIGGHRIAILNASVGTVKPAAQRFQMPFSVSRPPGRPEVHEPTQLTGWTCVEGDVLGESPTALEAGDWVVFENCGAYSFVLHGRFIRPTPAIWSLDDQGGWRLEREPDTVAQWLAPFRAHGIP